MVEDVYALPPSLLPCDPVDGCDTRYLNHSHQPVINPSKNPLDILFYNDTFFSSPSLTLPLKFDYTRETLRVPPHYSTSQFTFLSFLHNESKTEYPPRNIDQFITPTYKVFSPLDLFHQLTLSGKLFFIHYVPEQTIRPHWYLIEVLQFANAITENYSKDTCNYKVSFLARYLDDNALSDDLARWWPDWHEIIRTTTSTPNFGVRVLFVPHRIPPPDKYELWIDIIPLCNQNCYLLGPVAFEPRFDIIKPNQHVSRSIWDLLF